MLRTDVYLKVQLEHEKDDSPERLAQEICRQIQKIYGVRGAELSSLVERE